MRQDRENGLDVSKIIDSWTSQASYPILECKRTPDGRLSLSQKPLPGASIRNNGTWWIPIAFTDEHSALIPPAANLPRLWLSPDRPAVQVSPGNGISSNESWILINAETYGYYRVEYDERNWDLISKQLITNHSMISQKTRFQLIDDAFTLASYGVVPYDVPFKIIRYLKKRQDAFVLPRVLNYLDLYRHLLKDNSTMINFIEVS